MCAPEQLRLLPWALALLPRCHVSAERKPATKKAFSRRRKRAQFTKGRLGSIHTAAMACAPLQAASPNGLAPVRKTTLPVREAAPRSWRKGHLLSVRSSSGAVAGPSGALPPPGRVFLGPGLLPLAFSLLLLGRMLQAARVLFAKVGDLAAAAAAAAAAHATSLVLPALLSQMLL